MKPDKLLEQIWRERQRGQHDPVAPLLVGLAVVLPLGLVWLLSFR